MTEENLRFLVDESSGKKLALFLAEKGIDVKFVTDVMPGASDSKVLNFAERENRILITNDKDFGELVFRLNRPSSGVVLLRLRLDSPKNRERYLSYLIETKYDELKFSFVAVTEDKVRIRRIISE